MRKRIIKIKKGVLNDKLTLELQDFNKKKEMDRKIKEVIENKVNFNENALSKESKEA